MEKLKKRKVQVWIYGLTEAGDPRFLLLKTRPGRGEFWQPVTGSVEEGESFQDAALREATEETGISGKLTELSSFEFDGQWGHALEQGFALEAPKNRVDQPIQIDPKEHTDYEWVSAEEAKKRTHFESNRKILGELISQLSEKSR
jgi:dATP pyrophosphohydrolase